MTRELQLILPTDKRNPAFTLWSDWSDQTIHVYYGLELMQVVPQDREHAQYKLLVANLYNAGLNVRELEAVFNVDRKTMRRWGQALNSGDAQRLAQALEGRQGRRKLTPEIQSYIRYRFAEVYRQDRRAYSARLRAEVKAVFGVQLSGETLRPLLGSLRPVKDKRSAVGAEPEPGLCGAAPNAALASPVADPVLAGTQALGPVAEPMAPGPAEVVGVPGKMEEISCELAPVAKPEKA